MNKGLTVLGGVIIEAACSKFERYQVESIQSDGSWLNWAAKKVGQGRNETLSNDKRIIAGGLISDLIYWGRAMQSQPSDNEETPSSSSGEQNAGASDSSANRMFSQSKKKNKKNQGKPQQAISSTDEPQGVEKVNGATAAASSTTSEQFFPVKDWKQISSITQLIRNKCTNANTKSTGQGQRTGNYNTQSNAFVKLAEDSYKKLCELSLLIFLTSKQGEQYLSKKAYERLKNVNDDLLCSDFDLFKLKGLAVKEPYATQYDDCIKLLDHLKNNSLEGLLLELLSNSKADNLKADHLSAAYQALVDPLHFSNLSDEEKSTYDKLQKVSPLNVAFNENPENIFAYAVVKYVVAIVRRSYSSKSLVETLAGFLGESGMKAILRDHKLAYNKLYYMMDAYRSNKEQIDAFDKP